MTSTVENIDCMIAMKRYPDGYFDLSLVDPPYGIEKEISNGGGSHTKSAVKFHQLYSENNKKWDIKPSIEYFNELRRISKNQVICGGNYFADLLPPSRGWAIYDKVTDGVTCVNPELIYTSFHYPCKIFRRAHGLNNGFMNKEGHNIHPTQKPIQLYSWIYKNYLPNGGKVLDSHLGGGSNRIAADMAGNIDFTGYEIDTDYYNAQEQRFQNYLKQPRLPFPTESIPVIPATLF